MNHAAAIAQPEAPHAVDADAVSQKVQSSWTRIADGPFSPLHREYGRALAERLGYDPALLDRVPGVAVASFAGVGEHLGLAALRSGERVLDLGAGAGMDSFLAALQVGPGGRVLGIDVAPEQVAKARALRDSAAGFAHVTFREASAEALPLPDASVDCVIGNGVSSLVANEALTFAEAARVLRPGGRIALSDVVTASELPAEVARNGACWCAGLGGAMHRRDYQQALTAAGFSIELVQLNDYRFGSDAMQRIAAAYGARSISLVATRS